jgi:hypothetical protein
VNGSVADAEWRIRRKGRSKISKAMHGVDVIMQPNHGIKLGRQSITLHNDLNPLKFFFFDIIAQRIDASVSV